MRMTAKLSGNMSENKYTIYSRTLERYSTPSFFFLTTVIKYTVQL